MIASGIDDLTDKELETLRLMLRGHDAKSMARELSLSVHTINDRLRMARRKLGVTSSREAARIVFERESGSPENLADKELGSAPELPDEERERGGQQLFAHLNRNLVLGGILMFLITAAALLAFQGLAPDAQSTAPPAAQAQESSDRNVSPEMNKELEAAEVAALAFLEMADADDFASSTKSDNPADPDYAAWNALIERRQEFGKALSRDTHRIDIIERDGLDEWIVRFHTDFERLRGTWEKVTLAYDGVGFVAKDYEIE